MDDHFWPSLYPGLIVGALIGFADGGLVPALVGAGAGLAGAYGAFLATTLAGIEPGLLPLIAVVGGGALAAKLAVMLAGAAMRGISR
jgi:hypothetical protein